MNTNSHYKEYSKYILEEFQFMKTLKMILLLMIKVLVEHMEKFIFKKIIKKI